MESDTEGSVSDLFAHAPHVYHYPKVPAASVERIRELAGVFRLRGSAPSGRFLEDEAPELERSADARSD